MEKKLYPGIVLNLYNKSPELTNIGFYFLDGDKCRAVPTITLLMDVDDVCPGEIDVPLKAVRFLLSAGGCDARTT